MIDHFTGPTYEKFHLQSYRRFVFYFALGDDRTKQKLIIPDTNKPGEISDVRIEFCGKKINKSKSAEQWLMDNNAPDFVLAHTHRSEKAVDTQICCDALQLAETGKLDRLFLYTNDSDFIPLFRTLRQLGSNINLFRITAERTNKDLTSECDALHAMPSALLASAFKDER